MAIELQLAVSNAPCLKVRKRNGIRSGFRGVYFPFSNPVLPASGSILAQLRALVGGKDDSLMCHHSQIVRQIVVLFPPVFDEISVPSRFVSRIVVYQGAFGPMNRHEPVKHVMD